MAESRTVTGNRDDLVVDASRCLRMRFSESSCRLCIDSCPHGAVTLDGGLDINPEQCRGCMLCTSVCPVGALEQTGDFYACLAKLSKVPEPVLGCIRTKECSNATLACLGGLSKEHLLTLYHTQTGRLTLNLSTCANCPNSESVPALKQRLLTISAADLADGTCRIDLTESARDIHFRDESLDRRSFLKSLGTTLFRSAATVYSDTNDHKRQRCEYAQKRVPLRRELLNRTRDNLSQQLAVLTGKQFDSHISCNEHCTTCQSCVAICPTGALHTDLPDSPPTFNRLLCTGCGLCREFCMEGALQISTGDSVKQTA
jgi:ferredoxin